MVMSMWCFMQLIWRGCETSSHINCFSYLVSCQLLCMLTSDHLNHSKVLSMPSSIPFIFKPAPNMLSYAMWLDSIFCCTFLVSNSPTLLRLRNRCLLFTLLNFY